jgi:hypothetical protein
MANVRGTGLRDLAAVGVLLAAAAAIAWPVLTDGHSTYLDNPAHVAEVRSLLSEARSGWSDIAHCGFPLGTLHSPLWYGLLTALVRAGLPLASGYAALLFLGFVSPALAVYAVARRRLGAVAAGGLAFLLLVQRPVIVGLGSALGGMWTFYIASGALILLIDRLTRPCRTGRDVAWIAGLTGLIGLTHLYAIVALVVVAAVEIVRWLASRPRDRGELSRKAGAAVLGAAVAAWYWAPVVMAWATSDLHPQNLTPLMALARLALATDVLSLVHGRAFTAGTPVLESIPMFALTLLGLGSIAFFRRRADDVPLHGFALAGALFVLVALVAPLTEVTFLGPNSWRLLYFVRIGLALAAVPLLVEMSARLHRRAAAKSAGAAGIAVLLVLVALWSLWCGRPLRAEVPPSNGREMAEVRSLWSWLRVNRSDDWGRVYIQDTFQTPPRDASLARSHILALTASETGVRQLGATYTVVPYATAAWTSSELGRLFWMTMGNPEEFRRLLAFMRASNSTHLVTADPEMRSRLLMTPAFEELWRSERFAVLRLNGIAPTWVEPMARGMTVDVERFEPGSVALSYVAAERGDAFFLKSSYHPFWRASPAGVVTLSEESSGLMRVEALAPGSGRLELLYRVPAWPRWLSLLGAAFTIWLARRRGGHGPVGEGGSAR